MKLKLTYLRSLGMLALMGGGLVYALTGCGGVATDTTAVDATDTAIPFGQHLFVANHNAATLDTDQVLRYDNVLTQTTGATLIPGATFQFFATLEQISVDFDGNLIAPDFTSNNISTFADASLATSTVNQAKLQFAAVHPSACVFDSSNQKFYAIVGGTIQRFGLTGDLETTLTDSVLTDPIALAIDDQHNAGGVLMAVGKSATSGIVAIYPNVITAVGAGSLGTSNTASLNALAGVSDINILNGVALANPLSCAYSLSGEHLWIADPNAEANGVIGRVFRVDNVPNITNSVVPSAGSLQLVADDVAVDTSDVALGETLITVNQLLSNTTTGSIADVFAGSLIFTAGEEVTSAELAVPTLTLTLSGATDPISIAEDSIF